MPYVSQNYDHSPAAPLGTWVGAPPYYGQCVSYVKAVVPSLPQTSLWTKGALVKNNRAVQAGTVIATFNPAGHYSGHAAIYESQTKDGLNVVDQWITAPAKPIHRRLLRFGAQGNSNNGDNFFVVE
jgi:hypothetical protein